MKNGDKPIYPLQHEGFPSIDKVVESGCVVGLTKREYFAGLAMQGILAANAKCLHGNLDIAVYDEAAGFAIQYADELLKQLGE